MRSRVYVAGPISRGDLQHNLNQARAAGVALLRAGYAPLVPHLTCYMAGDTPEICPHNTCPSDWYGVDLPWVAAADALLRLPGDSVGADLEEVEARHRRIPVFYDVESLLANLPPEKVDGVDRQ